MFQKKQDPNQKLSLLSQQKLHPNLLMLDKKVMPRPFYIILPLSYCFQHKTLNKICMDPVIALDHEDQVDGTPTNNY